MSKPKLYLLLLKTVLKLEMRLPVLETVGLWLLIVVTTELWLLVLEIVEIWLEIVELWLATVELWLEIVELWLETVELWLEIGKVLLEVVVAADEAKPVDEADVRRDVVDTVEVEPVPGKTRIGTNNW